MFKLECRSPEDLAVAKATINTGIGERSVANGKALFVSGLTSGRLAEVMVLAQAYPVDPTNEDRSYFDEHQC